MANRLSDINNLIKGLTKEDLFNGLIKQESSGKQSAVSKKGAIGIAQVMPSTGPEAARMAGLEWDPQRFKNDPEYNKALGKAYLDFTTRQMGGDPVLGIVSYNQGIGNIQKHIDEVGDPRLGEISHEKFLATLPGPDGRGYVKGVLTKAQQEASNKKKTMYADNSSDVPVPGRNPRVNETTGTSRDDMGDFIGSNFKSNQTLADNGAYPLEMKKEDNADPTLFGYKPESKALKGLVGALNVGLPDTAFSKALTDPRGVYGPASDAYSAVATPQATDNNLQAYLRPLGGIANAIPAAVQGTLAIPSVGLADAARGLMAPAHRQQFTPEQLTNVDFAKQMAAKGGIDYKLYSDAQNKLLSSFKANPTARVADAAALESNRAREAAKKVAPVAEPSSASLPAEAPTQQTFASQPSDMVDLGKESQQTEPAKQSTAESIIDSFSKPTEGYEYNLPLLKAGIAMLNSNGNGFKALADGLNAYSDTVTGLRDKRSNEAMERAKTGAYVKQVDIQEQQMKQSGALGLMNAKVKELQAQAAVKRAEGTALAAKMRNLQALNKQFTDNYGQRPDDVVGAAAYDRKLKQFMSQANQIGANVVMGDDAQQVVNEDAMNSAGMLARQLEDTGQPNNY